MADSCVYCDGMVICDDDPVCIDERSFEALVANGWKHKGCFCVGIVDGAPELVSCFAVGDPKLILSVYTKGNAVEIIPVGACPPTT